MTRSSRLRLTLSGKVTAIFAAVLIVTAAATAAIVHFVTQPWLVFLLALAIGFPLGAWLLNRLMRPTREALRVLTDGIGSFKDRDYSVRLAPARNDELGRLVHLYNDLGDLLRQERSALYQKELMLDTVLQSSPTAMILTNPLERVVFSNRSARQLLFAGKKMEGHSFREVLQGCPARHAGAARGRQRRSIHRGDFGRAGNLSSVATAFSFEWPTPLSPLDPAPDA
ncbi:MAG: hypothetical protein ACR2L2_04215 [Acidobacteriota bacterium]